MAIRLLRSPSRLSRHATNTVQLGLQRAAGASSRWLSRPCSSSTQPAGAVVGRRFCSTSAAAVEASVETITPPTRAQLWRLALASGVPFVGFGIADNGIMIIAGDHIDASLGVRFGLSTLAAAGLGNLISDVCGISLGEAIEEMCQRMGLRAPALTGAQQGLRVTRLTKAGANALGISIGCLIGMLPLLFMHDRKSVYFDDDELLLYQTQFAPYGVAPQQFFTLLHHGKWHVAEPGTPLVRSGKPLDSVMFILSGEASAYEGDEDSRKLVYLYEGRCTSEGDAGAARLKSIQTENANAAEQDPSMKRGSIIGGSALIEPQLLEKPYPNTVEVSKRTKYLEWKTAELRAAMREDKSVEAAVFSTLYLDLVQGLRQQRREIHRRASTLDAGGGAAAGAAASAAKLREDGTRQYELMLRAVLSDEIVHPLERSLMQQVGEKHRISKEEHNRMLLRLGWTVAEWEQGHRDKGSNKIA